MILVRLLGKGMARLGRYLAGRMKSGRRHMDVEGEEEGIGLLEM